MTPSEEFKVYKDHQDKSFDSWFKNLMLDKDKRFNEGVWHQLRKFEPNTPNPKWSTKRLQKALKFFLDKFKIK